jgi:hypothetical protein
MFKTLHSFIVRVWCETEEPGDKEHTWRGSVEHVGSGLRLHFYDLDGVTRFIQEQTGTPDWQNRRWWQRLRVWIKRHTGSD